MERSLNPAILKRLAAKLLHSVVVGVLALALAAPLRAQCPDGTPPPCGRARTAAPNSVAVLYFDNLSRDTSDAYLADGLTDEVILRLGQVQRLAVKSRSAVRRFRGSGDLAPDVVGRALGVSLLVNGTVRRAGNRLRVTVELVRAADGTRVWGDAFDRFSGDLLAIQEDIARGVAEAIAGRLLPEERSSLGARPTRSGAAYDLYLRGLYLSDKYDEAELHRAIDLFEEALRADPRFALAQAAIAQAYARLADDWLSPAEAYPRARAAAERALALDSTLGEAHLALGGYLMLYEHDFAGAERAFRRAAALGPSAPIAHDALAGLFARQGRLSEASFEEQRSLELDPSQLVAAYELARILYFARRYDRAIAQTRQTLALEPDYPWANLILGDALLATGSDSAGLAALRGAHRQLHSARSASRLARALALTGHQGEARQLLDSLITLAGRRYVSADFIAAVYVALGEPDAAFPWLNRAVEQRAAPLLWLPVSPDWDAIRSDPRFQRLVVGLPAAGPR